MSRHPMLAHLPDEEKMLWYVATPYTNYYKGLKAAALDAAFASAKLISTGLIVYSPIAHFHPIQDHVELSHASWLEIDRIMMLKSDGLIIVQMPGWDKSKGVQMEQAFFDQMKKPKRFYRWPFTRPDGTIFLQSADCPLL